MTPKDIPLYGIELGMPAIDALIQELKGFELSNHPHPQVAEALMIVNWVMKKHKDLLIDRGVVPAYHGSLQYNDPLNLDLDLVFTTQDEAALKPMRRHILALEQEFERLRRWPRTASNRGHCYTNFHWYSIRHVLDEVEKLHTSGEPFNDENSVLDIQTCYVLTTSPVMRKAVIDDLHEALDIRRKRKQDTITP